MKKPIFLSGFHPWLIMLFLARPGWSQIPTNNLAPATITVITDTNGNLLSPTNLFSANAAAVNAALTNSGAGGNAAYSTNAGTATTATNFSGSLSGNVTGTQGATVVSSIGSAAVPAAQLTGTVPLASLPTNYNSLAVSNLMATNLTQGSVAIAGLTNGLNVIVGTNKIGWSLLGGTNDSIWSFLLNFNVSNNVPMAYLTNNIIAIVTAPWTTNGSAIDVHMQAQDQLAVGSSAGEGLYWYPYWSSFTSNSFQIRLWTGQSLITAGSTYTWSVTVTKKQTP